MRHGFCDSVLISSAFFSFSLSSSLQALAVACRYFCSKGIWKSVFQAVLCCPPNAVVVGELRPSWLSVDPVALGSLRDLRRYFPLAAKASECISEPRWMQAAAAAALQSRPCWHSCRIYCEKLHASLHVISLALYTVQYVFKALEAGGLGTNAKRVLQDKRAEGMISVNIHWGFSWVSYLCALMWCAGTCTVCHSYIICISSFQGDAG